MAGIGTSFVHSAPSNFDCKKDFAVKNSILVYLITPPIICCTITNFHYCKINQITHPLFPQKRLNERVLIDPTKTEEEETLPSLRSQNASSDEVNSE